MEAEGTEETALEREGLYNQKGDKQPVGGIVGTYLVVFPFPRGGK